MYEILKTYGQPDQVGLYTFRNEFMGSRPTGILLYYQDQGILIEYVGHRKVETVGDLIRICPAGTYNFLYLWPTEKEMDFSHAVNLFLDLQNHPFPQPLAEATQMDLETFYITYRDQCATTCFETPADLWPVY